MTDRLAWLKKSSKKKNTSYAIGERDETSGAKKLKMRRTKGSGATGLRKNDVFDGNFVGEFKATGETQYTLHLSDLKKLIEESYTTNLIPYFRLTFNKPRKQSFVIMMEDDFIELVSNGIEWKIKTCFISIKTQYINRSDWTNVHTGSAFEYDNKSDATNWTGQHITISDGGSEQKAIVIEDSGGTNSTGILYVYNITDFATSLGVWANNQTVTAGNTGATIDVNESSGSSKNIDYDIYHNLSLNINCIKWKIIISTDGTDNNSFDVENTTSTGDYGSNIFQIDSNSFKHQTGSQGMHYSNDALGSGTAINSQDWYFNFIIYIKL